MGWLSGPPAQKLVGGDAFGPGLDLGLNNPVYPEPSFMSFASQAFGRNELVYACIMMKATSLPEAPLRVFGPDGLGEPRENHPLRELIANPNPLLTEFELLELTVVHMDLAGIAFWEIVRDRAGRPVQLWPLRPDLVRLIRQRDGRTRYGYVLGGSIVDLGTDVLAFKYPNPVDPLVGQPPLRPALRAVALDNEATDFVKALLQNRAVPGVVITTQRKVDQDISDRLATKWKEKFGGTRRGEPAVLQTGMDVKVLGLDLQALEFPDLRTISESRICMAFGVPPILVGAKVGLDRSTFSNAAEARRSFWEETILPLQRRIGDVIVRRLLPEVNDSQFVLPRRVVVKFDNSGVLALKESEQAIWERALNALRAGAITVNTFNQVVGLPQVPGGDVYLRPAGVIPTLADGTPTGGAPQLPAGGQPADQTGDAAAGGEPGETASLSDEELARFMIRHALTARR
ncbi:phage portal protein [Streptomyces sp. NPDC001406]|uniref:phage portal protein n=1 Tax=Streptomyces sp. NPDC001406 TaxID=3364572 RepID=UPI0036C3FA56